MTFFRGMQFAVAALCIACGPSDEVTPDAAREDSGATLDASADIDAARDTDGGDDDDDGGERDGAIASDAPSTSDAAPPPFEAIAPCDMPSDYVDGTLVVAYDSNDYSPACLRVRRGTTVTIEASTDHPLAPRAGGTAGNPIPSATTDATIRFDEPGFYPFLCVLHDTLGMIGVVQVVP